MDLYRSIRKELIKMEDIRQRTKGEKFKGEFNGKLKIGIYVTQMAMKLLAERAEMGGSYDEQQGRLRERIQALEDGNKDLESKVDCLDKANKRLVQENSNLWEGI